MSRAHRVVIVGGGFGGLCAARALRRAPVEVTLVDRRNHHLFQPLLYQVATGGLSPANIASPLRALLKRQRNARVLLAEVVDLDLEARQLALDGDERLAYDSLVVAAGAGKSYFGRREWQPLAPGLKSLEDATAIRRRLLLAFERAEREADEARRRRLLTFVVIGGGPTGVELAGAMAEVAFRTLPGELRRVRRGEARVILVEAGERLLPAFVPPLSAAAELGLERLGVDVRCGWPVADLSPGRLHLRSAEDGREAVLETANVFWAAGVAPSPLGRRLAEQSGARCDRAGRVIVGPDCSVPGRPEVFVVGDLAHFAHGLAAPLPGLAPVAMQQGRYVARRIRDRLRRRSTPAFRYVDKGAMATIGRSLAVAEIGRFRFAGFFAWLTWLFVHLMYLTEFENRVLVLIQWGWNYVTRNRSARLITEPAADPGAEAAGRTFP
ncbi:MAG: NAD(P)/FAD-dependent oxidoreductase [Acidobacteria bacterium]|nr:MAG: NAD(P)/FAD-dependent oxidoreductase [Acidobacteriota bacterium]